MSTRSTSNSGGRSSTSRPSGVPLGRMADGSLNEAIRIAEEEEARERQERLLREAADAELARAVQEEEERIRRGGPVEMVLLDGPVPVPAAAVRTVPLGRRGAFMRDDQAGRDEVVDLSGDRDDDERPRRLVRQRRSPNPRPGTAPNASSPRGNLRRHVQAQQEEEDMALARALQEVDDGPVPVRPGMGAGRGARHPPHARRALSAADEELARQLQRENDEMEGDRVARELERMERDAAAVAAAHGQGLVGVSFGAESDDDVGDGGDEVDPNEHGGANGPGRRRGRRRGGRRQRQRQDAAILRQMMFGSMGIMPPMGMHAALAARHGDAVDVDRMSYEELLELEQRNGPVVKPGADPQGIQRLPTHVFRAGDGSLKLTCAVCLNDVEEGENLRVLPCFHQFHTDCIDRWLEINDTCPTCKKRAVRTD